MCLLTRWVLEVTRLNQKSGNKVLFYSISSDVNAFRVKNRKVKVLSPGREGG